MNAGKAVYGILSTNAEVTAIVGTKIFPEVAEQETALPLIVYQLQSVAPEDTHDGPSKLDEVRFEFLCYADTYNGAADLGDKVRGALDRVSGTYNAVNVESVQFNDVDIDVIDAPRRYGQSLTFTFRIKRDDVEIAQGTPVTGAMLGDLYNVDVAGVTDNQILSYDAATGNWVPADDAGGLVDSVNGLTGTVILNFDDLNDVDTGTPSDGQLIAYQQGEWVTIDQDEIHIPINSVTGLQTELNTIPTDLSDLSDVSIVGTPAGNQALIYNSATNAFTSQDSYTNRFEDEVETGKVMPTIFAERAYSVKSEGDGVFIDPESDTPAAGKVIVRKIYHKAGFITDADVIGDYTLIHTFADDTAYADTVATFEGFRDGNTYGTPPFTLLQTWAEETAAPSFTGLLNESYGSGAAAAYGTRRLNGNYSGACMTIRRASDGTTQAIGFVGEEIDESAITTFCTGTTCTVQVWHDQSQTGGTGSGNDAEQTNSTKQPTIYTGGQLVKEGGRLALDFDGVSNELPTPTIFSDLGAGNAVSVFHISKCPDTTDGTVYNFSDSASANFFSFGYNFTSGNYGSRRSVASGSNTFSGDTYNNAQSLFSQISTTTTNNQVYKDGTAATLTTTDGASRGNQSSSVIGSISTNRFMKGNIQEIVSYTSDKSSVRTDIEGNISAYYQSAKLLDEQYGSGAEAAYSVRQLKRDNTECMVIRRASDSTTTTIGFDASGNIDEAAITTFCTGTSCTVYQWLDQSGNGNTATTTGTEPIIYTGGAIIKDEGKVAIDFQTAYSPLKYTGQDLNLSAITATLIGRETSQSGSQGWGIVMQSDNNNGFRTHYQGTSVRNRTTGTNLDAIADASVRLTRFIHDIASSTALMKSTLNGVVTATGNGKTFSTNGLDLAVGGSSYSTVQFRGNLSEAILFGVDKYTSGDIASIRENVGDYFTQNTPLLDTYTGAAACYSLRLMRTAYTGSAIRVRRSSDNTEQDIGFNVFSELDTVSLAAFCGSSDGFVVKFYDQSGNGNHMLGTTSTLYNPKIYDSVTGVIKRSQKNAIDFTGSYSLRCTTGQMNQTNTTFFVADLISGKPIDAGNRTTRRNYETGGGNLALWAGSSPFTYTTGGGFSGTSNLQIISTVLNGNSTEHKLNNNTEQTCAAGTNASTGFYFGGQGNGTGDSYPNAFNGSMYISEFIAYPSDESAYRTEIHDNMNTFYSIY